MSTLSTFLLALAVCGLQAQGVVQAPPPREASKELEKLKAKGPAQPVMILPVLVSGKPFDRVTEVLALFLEQKGMTALELCPTAMDPGRVDLAELAASVGKAVQQAPPGSKSVLYAEFNGSRLAGMTELRAVLVDASGTLLWTLRWGTDDPELKDPETRNPLGMAKGLADRLAPLFGCTAQTAKAAKPGPMARLMEVRSGLPPQAEREAMAPRLAALKKAGPTRELILFPPRLNGEIDPEGTKPLVRLLSELRVGVLREGPPDLLLKSPQKDPNEMKILWDLARDFREQLRQKPAGAYTLYSDFAFNPVNWQQGYVHFVVCDPSGEWVLVEYMNSHHPLYQAVKPASPEACRLLVAKRLEGLLQ
ncbi:MAG: hypothetical protein HY823_00765 [Acidobacteria bacterium]|nr:hypothetical protein [Acidobacteriota bacterium]